MGKIELKESAFRQSFDGLTIGDKVYFNYQDERKSNPDVNAEKNSSKLSRDEVCQKHFGKDYVYQNGGRSADFCVGDSGIPKYPKTWIEKR